MATGEIIDLTKDTPSSDGVEEAIPHLPITLNRTAHRTIGVTKDGDVLAYPLGKGHGEETEPVWIDPTGRKIDGNGLTQSQRGTIEYASDTPLFNSEDSDKIKLLSEINGVDLCSEILILHALIAPDTEQSPTPEHLVIYRNKDEIIDKPTAPEERFNLIDVVSKMVNDVAKWAQEAGTEEATKAALIRISNLIALATVISHPFEDGNGRTSRALYFLTRFGVPQTDDEKLAFGIVSQKRPEENSGRRIEVIRPNIKPDQPNIKSWLDSINFASSPKIPLTKEGQERYEHEHSEHFFTLFKNTIA